MCHLLLFCIFILPTIFSLIISLTGIFCLLIHRLTTICYSPGCCSMFDMGVSSTGTGRCVTDGCTMDISWLSGTSLAPRWWKQKALHTLKTTSNLYDIRLVCQHIPFADQSLPSTALSQNWIDTHDTFLATLKAKEFADWGWRIGFDGVHKQRKAEELVRLLMSEKRVSVPIQAVPWYPPGPRSSKEPSSIAE